MQTLLVEIFETIDFRFCEYLTILPRELFRNNNSKTSKQENNNRLEICPWTG